MTKTVLYKLLSAQTTYYVLYMCIHSFSILKFKHAKTMAPL